MKSTEKTILAFALGATVGVILGVLFAPEKGAETRRRLQKEYERRREQLDDLMDGFGEIVREGKESFREAVAEGREKFGKVRSTDKNDTSADPSVS